MPERRQSQVSNESRELGKLKIHELIIPIIKSFNHWIEKLASLALEFESDDEDEEDSVKNDIKAITNEIMKEMNPNLRKLAFYERYVHPESNLEISKSIGILNLTKLFGDCTP